MTLEEKVRSYTPSDESKEIVKSTKIVLLVGPIGVGKTELKNKLLSTNNYHHIISHTTRSPRYNHGQLEQDGQEYHFINLSQAEAMLDNHQFIEAKYINSNIYGTSISEIEQAKTEHKIAITDVDVQGVGEYKDIDKNVKAIFLVPPDFKTWQERIEKRHGDEVKVEDYAQRLRIGLNEFNELLTTDHFIALINQDMRETLNALSKITTSDKLEPVDDSHAREVAKKLSEDIKTYLKNIT